MEYIIGKYYTFDFKEKYIGKDDNIYLKLTDPNNPESFISVKPYVFQYEWDNTISKRLECFCFKQDVYGRYCFTQSRAAILNLLYAPYLNHYNEFVIEKRLETDNNRICCAISDNYGFTQLYYPKDRRFWDYHQVGDELNLCVKGIHPSDEGKNNAYLELESCEETSMNSTSEKNSTEIAYIRDEKAESLGSEDDYTEFKSSIAFPAGGTEEDMPKQLMVIMKSIAGFMNKDGGILYIGVNDSGEPFKDISEEFQYLNDDPDDKYTYNANADHYKLKLNNKIRTVLSDYASSLVNITFRQANGVTYAAIEVKKSESVVWYQGLKLFVRCDNCTRLMIGDNITNFILSRVTPNTLKTIVNTPVSANITDVIDSENQQSKTDTVAIRVSNVQPREKVWRYITFFKNGQWSFHKIPSKLSDELLTEVPILNKPKNQVMMIAYESGKINAVALKDLLYGSGRNKNTLITCDTIRNNGILQDSDKVVNVFCIRKGGIVLMESVVNGDYMVKAHQMDVITTHQSLSAQGNKMQPEGTLIRIAPIEAESGEMNAILSMGILVKDYERYSKNGVKKTDLQGKYQELIDKILS